MNSHGVIIGGIAFLIIGIFHPIVIKGEYYFGTKIWPLFLFSGLAALTASLVITHTLVSAVLGVLGFTCLWSILELFEQAERVRKGWFPHNPKRHTPKPPNQ